MKITDTTTPQSEYATLIAKGAAIVFLGTVASGGLRYMFQVIVARNIGVELFGLFSLGLGVFGIAGAIASLGLGRGVVRYVSLFHGAGDRRRMKGTISLAVALALSGGIVVGLALIAVSEVLAIDVFHSAGLGNVLGLLAIATPFFALTAVLLSSTQALRIMRYRVYVRDLFEPLSRIVLTIWAFLLGWKLSGAVFAYVVSIAAGTILSFLLFRSVFQPMLGDRVRSIFEPKAFVAYCWPLLFANSFYLVETWISTLLLGYFSTSEEVGLFSAARSTSLLLLAILTSFTTMFAPIISDLHHRGEDKKLESLFKTVAKWVFSLSLPAALLMIIFAQEILTVFGETFVAAAASLVVLSVGQLIYCGTGPLGVMIDMSGRSKITLLNSVLHLLLQTGLGFLLIPRYGIMGASLASFISVCFQRAIRLLEVRLILKMHPFGVGFLKPLIASGVSWLILSLIRVSILRTDDGILLLILGSSIFLAVYGLMLYGLGFDEEDQVILQRTRAKLAFR